jgi:lycopene beta-cyclase
MQKQYDYIIAGMGGSGLGLAWQLSHHPVLSKKKVLLLDKGPKNTNDRTWCFWEKGDGPFEDILFKSWSEIFFRSNDFDTRLNMAPYKYKMIRGLDFYNHVLSHLQQFSNFEVRYELVQSLKDSAQTAAVITENNIYHADYVFSSIMPGNMDTRSYDYLLQHFKGYFIRTEQPVFKPGVATFMDFQVEQGGEVRFFYVLPSDEKNALVEIAIFSEKIWEDATYDSFLHNYIEQSLRLSDWEIKETEFGIIPMTNYPFEQHQGKRLINLGTAGGQVQGSTGFAFKNMQLNANSIVNALAEGKHPLVAKSLMQKRYKLYDDILLGILKKRTLVGRDIFTNIFRKNPTDKVFDFLDRTSSFGTDLSIMLKLPQWPFIQSFGRVIGKSLSRKFGI